MNRRTELKLRQLYVVIIAWLFAGLLIAVYDYLVLHTQYSRGTTYEYNFLFSLAINMGSGFIGALLGGSFLIFYVNVRYRDKPYGYTIIAVIISFILIIYFITIVRGVIYIPAKTGKPLFDEESREAFIEFLLYDTTRIKNTIIWSVVVALTQLFLQMNSKFGYGIFWNILRGKYNTPKEENRIFMSLDLNSSTTIAEQLGDEKYHGLLRDFFRDITNPVLDNNGEIYQYVGDEVVIAWRYEDGIINNQCIKCFFDMKMSIENQREKYLESYGIIPSFKAGIHSGSVVVGEVGIVKRDITYSGDVMNTTSRIRNKCKEYNADVLVSGDLLKSLNLTNYAAEELGAIKLRGKEKEVLLISLKPVG